MLTYLCCLLAILIMGRWSDIDPEVAIGAKVGYNRVGHAEDLVRAGRTHPIGLRRHNWSIWLL